MICPHTGTRKRYRLSTRERISRTKGVPGMLRALSRVYIVGWHLHLVVGGRGALPSGGVKPAGEWGGV